MTDRNNARERSPLTREPHEQRSRPLPSIVDRKSSIATSLRAALRAIGAPEDTRVVLELPRTEDHGDLVTPVAFSLAGPMRRPARVIAEAIVRHLPPDPALIAEVQVAGAGFINIRLAPTFHHLLLRDVIALGDRYVQGDQGEGMRAIIISADSSARDDFRRYRGSVLADAIASLLERTGHEVSRRSSSDDPGYALRAELLPAPPPPPNEASSQAIRDASPKIRTFPYRPVSFIEGGTPLVSLPETGLPLTPRNLIPLLGEDMVRFFCMMGGTAAPLSFDLDLAREHSGRNPLRYLQYAHARIAGLLRHAALEGLQLDAAADLSPLRTPEELALIRRIILFPETIARAARELEPALLIQGLRDLISAFERFHHACRIFPEPPPLRDARLLLLAATRRALANGLEILGLAAPERI